MTADLITSDQVDWFEQACDDSQAGVPGTHHAIASALGGARFFQSLWWGVQGPAVVLRPDAHTLDIAFPYQDFQRGLVHPVVFRSYQLPVGWDADTLAPILAQEVEHAARLLPEDYVHWFATEYLSFNGPTRYPFPHATSDDRHAWETAGTAVANALAAAFGAGVQIDTAVRDSGGIVARLYEAFEISIMPLDRAATSQISVTMLSTPDGFPNAALHVSRFKWHDSWQEVELVERMTDVRTWCLKVLPQDFVAELELAYGPLPGVSGPYRGPTMSGKMAAGGPQ